MNWLIKIAEFFEKNQDIFVDNWLTFLIFALLIIALTSAITRKITKAQYDSLADRVELQRQVDDLTAKNQQLKEQLRELQTSDRLVQGAHGVQERGKAGKLVDSALHETESA